MNRTLHRRNSSRALAALVFSCCAAFALPESVRGQCLGLSVSGTPGRGVFADDFESGDTAAWPAPAAPAIAIAPTTDLAIVVTVDSGLVGDHLLELRFEAPGGFLYQSVSVPFSAAFGENPATAGERNIPGYPFPVAVHSPGHGARLAGGQLDVDFALPVAGTPIAQTSITGAWRIFAYLDSAEVACLPPARFLLEP